MLDQLGIGRIPLLWKLRHHSVDDIGRLVGNRGGKTLKTHGPTLELLECDERGALGIVGRTAREGMEEGSTQAVDVTPEIFRLFVQLLGSNVIGRAPDFIAGNRRVVHCCGETKIHQLECL